MAEDPHFTDGIKERLRSRMEFPTDEKVTLFFHTDEYESSRRCLLSGGGAQQQQPELTGSLNAINGRPDKNFSMSSDDSQQQPGLTGSLNAINGRQPGKTFSLSPEELTLTGQSSTNEDKQEADVHTSRIDVSLCEDTESRGDMTALAGPDPSSIAPEPLPMPADDGGMSTCRYDGVEMQALDLDNIYFDTMRRQPTGTESVAAMERSVENLAKQSCSYSDNEKQLLEEVSRTIQPTIGHLSIKHGHF